MTHASSRSNYLLPVLRVLAVLTLAFTPVFATLAHAPAAYAASPAANPRADPPPPPTPDGSAAITDVFFNLAQKIITIVIMVSVAIFGVSLVFGASGAQIANMLGSPMAVSQSWMRVFTAVVTFLFVVLTPMLVNLIFGFLKPYFSGSVTLPRF